jgi:DnaD/phage-associated family protein
VFFTDLLPQLAGDPAALGVVLYAFKALQVKRGSPRYLTPDELRGDAALATYLAGAGASSDDIERGLARAVELGVLLGLSVEREGPRRTLYFLNAPADRRAMEGVRAGAHVEFERGEPADAAPRQPKSIFALYESVVGALSAELVDELAEAERLYPPEWLEAAFREAAAQNARSWRYVSRILERWAIEGPDYAKTERDAAGGGARYFRGKYGRILKQRLGG